MLKSLLIVGGSLSFILGAVGIVLPILPTTPFFLLSAYCFARSSERLFNYLINHRVFGSYISNYYHHAMTKTDKIRTLSLLWLGMGLSILLIGQLIPALILPLIAAAVTVHILRLTPRPEKMPDTGPDTADPALSTPAATTAHTTLLKSETGS
ncbi:YbaN family protein [Corynebacterium alimapuense]|uniref:DUF454 domain-containing protein n=1 Tax=Corynebacterium alimapuense TaxID=1576874 RepID=A0A3M8K4S9_9CORY|nr:YbaN family protein [Corynebacterium alimapuense]RNE48100.1 DUF454 domain-containing protein [Corynebacterium alimapuense]